MSTLLLLLLTTVPALAVQEDERTAPDPREVASTVETVKDALSGGEKSAKLKALTDASRVPAKDVVLAVGLGFRDREREVVAGTIQSLRFLDHPEALVLLQRTYKSDRSIRKDPELSAAILKAIGQHGDPTSIKILAKDPFDTEHYAIVRARILGLGRIRDRAAIEALLDLMKVTTQRTIDRYMGDFRLSLVILTGTDQGPSARRWQSWWKDVRKTFEVSSTRPSIPRTLAEEWVRYWGLERDYGRPERREDRGNDPERRRGL